MAGQRIDIMELRELILLKQQGLSNRKAAKHLGASRNTVNSYVKIFEAYHLEYGELLELNDTELAELFPAVSEVEENRYKELAQYFSYFKDELKKPGCTLQVLWQEYLNKHPDGYKSTQFNYHFNRWLKKGKGSLRIDHKAGQALFIDFTGKKLHIVDRQSGELQDVNVFVAILPCSQYTFVTAVTTQSRENVIRALNKCLRFLGGVPQVIIADNLKAVVNKASKYSSKVNRTLKHFGLHYNCCIDATRPYSAKDKAMVEGAVKLVYQRIFYPLSKHTFFSLEELNREIETLLTAYNNYQFNNTDSTRTQDFHSIEKEWLQPLPAGPYELRYYKRLMVQQMGYVQLSDDKHYYSAPYQYIGKRVEVEYTQKTVEIYYKGKRIATHPRDFTKGKYSTIEAHLCTEKNNYTKWSLEYFQQKAEKIGSSTKAYITKIIEEQTYAQTGYKQVLGIISFRKQYPDERIEEACRRALPYHKHGYYTIESILKKGIDLQKQGIRLTSKIPEHKNIRGKNHYQ